MIFAELLSCAVALKDLLSHKEKVSDLNVSIDRKLEYMSVINVGQAKAYNITVDFKETNWNNPFLNDSFTLYPGEKKEMGLFLTDYDKSSAFIDLNWTDETQGDLYKNFLLKV